MVTLAELEQMPGVDAEVFLHAVKAAELTKHALARASVQKAIDGLPDAQAARRSAVEVKKQAKAAYDDALAEAIWTAESTLVEDGGKTYVPLEGDERRLLAASDRSAWCTRQARKDPSVLAAAEGLRRAEAAVAIAEDGERLAERRIDAAHWELDGAIAATNLLARAIQTRSDSK